jgi:hypothetical protein
LPRRKVPTELEVPKEILNYFLRHPEAADDLEGVARWRLLNEQIDRSVEETRKGLEWLVRRGFLLKAERTGAATIYSLNEEELAAAKAFLKKPAPNDDEASPRA